MKYLLVIAFITACTSNKHQLTDKAREMEVYSSKPTNCIAMDKVIGMHDKGSKDLALNDALNQAASLGATGVFVNQEVPNGSKMAVHATSYKCE